TGPKAGDTQARLREGHRPTDEHVRLLREELPKRFPGVTFAFLPADIVSQILNFGAPAPIDIQVRGPDLAANFEHASRLLNELKLIPGIADARIQQSRSLAAFAVEVDRTLAQLLGLTERDVTNSLVVTLAATRPPPP